MKPTMTIIGYLYGGRNTWLRHDDECRCPAEELIKVVLDQLPVEEYLTLRVIDSDGSHMFAGFQEKTDDEWDEICGPKAEARVLNKLAEQYMNQASEVLAVLATKERLSSE